jgi:hypothetical protein
MLSKRVALFLKQIENLLNCPGSLEEVFGTFKGCVGEVFRTIWILTWEDLGRFREVFGKALGIPKLRGCTEVFMMHLGNSLGRM